MLARANGEIAIGDHLRVARGHEIRVMPRVDTNGLQIARDLVQIIYQMAITLVVPFRL